MMRSKKITPTTKTIDEFAELYSDGRLDLTPDFQRNSVWTGPAKAYLVDTILRDMPIPLLFLTKERDTNSNRLIYRVIDGQQRIRAVLAFLDNHFTIKNEYKIRRKSGSQYTRIRYRHLPEHLKEQFIGYSFVVNELSGFTEEELRDIFVRINKYVVKLNPQELRDAQAPGPFRDFVDHCSNHKVWERLGLFTSARQNRKRDKEFIAELTILLLEGPQDKKGSLDLYYSASKAQFSSTDVQKPLISTAELAEKILGNEPPRTLLRLPAFYGLMGALFRVQADEDLAKRLQGSVEAIQDELLELVEASDDLPEVRPDDAEPEEAKLSDIARDAFVFRRSLSQQTDNIKPRNDRIGVLINVIRKAIERS